MKSRGRPPFDRAKLCQGAISGALASPSCPHPRGLCAARQRGGGFAFVRGAFIRQWKLPFTRMVDPIDDLVRAWKKNPSPTTTVALCEALRANPRGALVQQVGEFAKERHASDVSVLVSVARMYIEATRFMDAQAVLVAAGKQAPREGNVYRWLGEVLLRRGDAERAEKVLERAIQLGATDHEAKIWLERARSYRPMQSSAGGQAVAAEVAHGAARSSFRWRRSTASPTCS